MKLLKLIWSAFCFLLGASGLQASGFDTTPQEAVLKLTNKKAVIVDVREIGELKQSGIAKGAVWLAMSSIRSEAAEFKRFLKDTPKSTEIILYCRSGGRAGGVKNKMKSLGYGTVFNMGGLVHWRNAGLEIVSYP